MVQTKQSVRQPLYFVLPPLPPTPAQVQANTNIAQKKSNNSPENPTTIIQTVQQ